MAPKPKISADMIVNAAVEVIRRDGFEALTARSAAKELGCSTQPLLYYFDSIEAIRTAAYEQTDEIHSRYILPKEDDPSPLLTLGMNYIRFAQEEKNLFRFLFQSGQFAGMDMKQLFDHPQYQELLKVLTSASGLSLKQAKESFEILFITVHGYAGLLANNAMDYEEEHCRKILTSLYRNLFGSGKGGNHA